MMNARCRVEPVTAALLFVFSLSVTLIHVVKAIVYMGKKTNQLNIGVIFMSCLNENWHYATLRNPSCLTVPGPLVENSCTNILTPSHRPKPKKA